jgi:hypothetical protein
VPVAVNTSRLGDPDYVLALIDSTEQSWRSMLEHEIHQSDRLHLLHNRFVTVDGVLTFQVDKMQPYLRVPHARHRRALFRLLSSSHHLAVERQRYSERGITRRPRELRVCRFCLSEVEDEEHAIFVCRYLPLRVLREEFLRKVNAVLGAAPSNDRVSITEFSRSHDPRVLNMFACLVYDICCIFEGAPMCYLPVI